MTASITVAAIFVFISAQEFSKSTVVTTIKSTTDSIEEVHVSECDECYNVIHPKVFFPSVTICNINQVRESFFLDMKLDSEEPENKKIIDLLYKQFYSGSLKPTTAEDEAIVKGFLTSENYVRAGDKLHCSSPSWSPIIVAFFRV